MNAQQSTGASGLMEPETVNLICFYPKHQLLLVIAR